MAKTRIHLQSRGIYFTMVTTAAQIYNYLVSVCQHTRTHAHIVDRERIVVHQLPQKTQKPGSKAYHTV